MPVDSEENISKPVLHSRASMSPLPRIMRAFEPRVLSRARIEMQYNVLSVCQRRKAIADVARRGVSTRLLLMGLWDAALKN